MGFFSNFRSSLIFIFFNSKDLSSFSFFMVATFYKQMRRVWLHWMSVWLQTVTEEIENGKTISFSTSYWMTCLNGMSFYCQVIPMRCISIPSYLQKGHIISYLHFSLQDARRARLLKQHTHLSDWRRYFECIRKKFQRLLCPPRTRGKVFTKFLL